MEHAIFWRLQVLERFGLVRRGAKYMTNNPTIIVYTPPIFGDEETAVDVLARICGGGCCTEVFCLGGGGGLYVVPEGCTRLSRLHPLRKLRGWERFGASERP